MLFMCFLAACLQLKGGGDIVLIPLSMKPEQFDGALKSSNVLDRVMKDFQSCGYSMGVLSDVAYDAPVFE